MKSFFKLLLACAVLGSAGYGAYLLWLGMAPPPLPPGIAAGNGRIEATDIDIATKFAGRLEDVLVREGDTVEAGQVVARMDTRTLAAQYREAEAQAQQKRDARQSAAAVVVQRESELAFARTEYRRSQEIAAKKLISQQQLDTDRTRMETAQAVVVAARSQLVEAGAAILAAEAEVERLKAEVADAILKSPRHGRVQYRLAEPGEVLAAGGRVVTILDLSDVYMKLFLPETAAGKVAIGAEARLVLDAAPDLVIPGKAYYVAAEAQFTPKAVETAQERQKLAFQVRLRIDPELLRRYEPIVKTGVPGVAYVKLDAATAWPARLEVKLPPPPTAP